MRILNTNKREIHLTDDELNSLNKKFKFGKYEFSLNEFPKCGLCNSDLIFMKNKTVFSIIKCENKLCESHKLSPEKRLKYFLNDEEFKKYYEFRQSYSQFSIKYWLKKGLSEEDAKKKLAEIQSFNSKKLKPENRFLVTKENLIKKYGLEKAEQICKERSNLTPEYWIKRGYSEVDARKEINRRQHENVMKCRRYMQEHPEKYTDIYPTQINYWLKKGFTEEEAELFVKEKQITFSLDKCIQKYGEIEGKKRFLIRQLKWQQTLHENGNLHVGYSLISQKLFDELLKFYPLDNQDYIFYGSKNKEYSIRYDGKNFVYDFTDLNNRKIIEFQGDIYHGNPNIFKEDDFPNPFDRKRSAKQIWEYDKLKFDIARIHRV